MRAYAARFSKPVGIRSLPLWGKAGVGARTAAEKSFNPNRGADYAEAAASRLAPLFRPGDQAPCLYLNAFSQG